MILASMTVLRGRDVVFQPSSYPYPATNANIVTHLFLQSGKDEMVFIDTDVVFRAWQLQELLSRDELFVNGAVPMKKLGLEFGIVPLDGHSIEAVMTPSKALKEVKVVNRGFTKIHRDVFTALDNHPDVIEFTLEGIDGVIREYWKGKDGGHSDDFTFCDRYRRVGGKVYLDNRLLLEHEGNIRYPVKGSWTEQW